MSTVIACDHMNPLKVDCAHARRFAELLNVYGFRLCNSPVPTCRPANSVIDAIAVRPADCVLRSVPTCCHVTPHNFPRTFLSVSTGVGLSRLLFQLRYLSRGDFDAFSRTLSECDWLFCYHSCFGEVGPFRRCFHLVALRSRAATPRAISQPL